MYDILKSTSPKMPELIKRYRKHLYFAHTDLKNMHEPIVPVLFPVFWGAYLYS